jgi:methyl-accepting chemotaxis protein
VATQTKMRATTAASRRRQSASDTTARNGTGATIPEDDLQPLLDALRAAAHGERAVRLDTRRKGMLGQVARAFNELSQVREKTTDEIVRVATVIGREGRLTERAQLGAAEGTWKAQIDSVNLMIEDLVRPTTEVARVLDAVAEGDLAQKMQLKIEGRPVKGEFLRIGTTVNAMVAQLSSFADEVTRVAKEVGTEGILGGQAQVEGLSGTWRGHFSYTHLTLPTKSTE